MKITIEAHPPRWLKRCVLYGLIPAIGVFGLVRVLRADVTVPNAFAPGDLMSSAKINDNFKALQSGINTLGATVATVQAGVAPAGSIVAFGGPVAPNGWLLCDGRAVSRTEYAALFAAIGTANGSGDDTTTFNLPDLRGRFLRGVDHGAGRDPEAASRADAVSGAVKGDRIGTVQDGAFQNHDHGGKTKTESDYPGAGVWYDDAQGYTAGSGSSFRLRNSVNHGASHRHAIDPQGGIENRPINLAVDFMIKY